MNIDRTFFGLFLITLGYIFVILEIFNPTPIKIFIIPTLFGDIVIIIGILIIIFLKNNWSDEPI